jgi:hypothetical protein
MPVSDVKKIFEFSQLQAKMGGQLRSSPLKDAPAIVI